MSPPADCRDRQRVEPPRSVSPVHAQIPAGLLVLGLLGACGGGGGGGSDAPPTSVSFSFELTAGVLSESDAPLGVLVVLHAAPPELEASASVQVVDTGAGTATSLKDYAAFPAQTITFPVGARDGDSQVVLLRPLDDKLVDGASETVRLRLQLPSVGELAGNSEFTLTLTDIHTAAVAFASAASTTPDESNRFQAVALELDCGPGVSLDVTASVVVSDPRVGSADPASDYSAALPKVVVFSAGLADGAVKTVSLQVVDDGVIEGDETVVLRLSTPSATCSLGSILSHQLTIKDDDHSGGALFLASEGPTGRENPLAFLGTIALGSQTVGAGPNAGTLVRVLNGGGAPMDLGTPRITGTHRDDFAVEVESSSALDPLGLPGPGQQPSGGQGSAAESGGNQAFSMEPAPVHALEDDLGPGLALRLDPLALPRLAALERVALMDFPLPDLGPVVLELERRPLPLRPDAKLVIDDEEIQGGVRTLVGDLQLWRGGIAGMPDSRVFLTLWGGGIQGFLELPFAPERLMHVTTDGLGHVRVLGEGELAALGVEPREVCAGERLAPGQPFVRQLGAPTAPSTSALTVADCALALETDFQLFQKLGSSTGLTNYVTALIGAVSDQYFTDVQTTLSIAYLGIHTTASDGWTTQETPGANNGDLLDEFQAAWRSGWPVQADIAHFLSGATLGGGIAYVDVLCNPLAAFGVSASLNGLIDWRTWTGQSASFTWDFVVVAHEIGHNFGSVHTHEFCPPLDRCWTNCAGVRSCSRGTLMSYCHTCGDLSFVDLRFHPVTAEVMRERVNASCLDRAALSPGDFVQYRLRFNPLTDRGTRSGTLEFTHDASNFPSPFRVRLSGTAN